MSVRSGQSITTEFTTRAFSTGAATDATGTPTGILFVNGTADAASVTVTNQATGRYKAAVTLPTLAIGDVVNLVITATVGGVTDSAKVWEDTKDVNLDASGNVVLQDASLVTAKLGTFVLAKTTNITGFNDIAAGAAMTLTSAYDAAKTALTVSAFNPPANWSAMAIAPVTGYVSADTLQVGGVDVEPTDVPIAADLQSVLGTSLTEGGSGRLAAAFKKLFDVATPLLVADTVIPTTAQIADKLLGRNIAGGSDGGRTVSEAFYVSRNKVVRTATTLTVYDVSDSSVSWTATLTNDANLNPLASVDPA